LYTNKEDFYCITDVFRLVVANIPIALLITLLPPLINMS